MSASLRLSLPAPTLSNIAFACYMLCITLLPIGFGGNRDVPFGIAQIGLALSAVLLVIEQAVLKGCFWPKRIIWAFGLFAIAIIWGFLQTQSFMPSDWHHPLWQESAKALKTPLEGSIALWRDEAFFSINRIITYIAAGTLGYVFAQDTARAKLMLQALWYSGIALCIYGYFNVMTDSIKVLWVDKLQYQHDLTSTFMSKNHFAIYAAMVLLCGCALLYQSWRNALRETREKHAIKAFMIWAAKAYTAFFLVLYVFGAILLSHSRAALLLSMLGVSIFFICYQLYAKRLGRAFLLFVISAICFAAIISIAVESSEHFASLFTDQSSLSRMSVYDMCIAAIGDNPWLGYGLGSFQAVFRMYNQSVSASFDHAHSDILESLVDLGLPAGLMLWMAMLLLISGLVRGISKRRRNGLYPALGLATTLMVLVHSGVDFSLQIPGVAMPFAMLLGVGLAQSWGASDKPEA